MVRFKNRYFLFEIIFGSSAEGSYIPRDLNSTSIQQALRQYLELYYGDFGVASLAHSLTGILNYCLVFLHISFSKIF